MAILTDFYELTMCQGYYEMCRNAVANFDLFARRLPGNRSYLVCAGLEQVLNYLQQMRFTDDQLEYLAGQGLKEDFLDYLRDFRFTGDVWAFPEGTIAFPDEPLIRVTGPIIEAQLIESFLLSTVNLQTALAKGRMDDLYNVCPGIDV